MSWRQTAFLELLRTSSELEQRHARMLDAYDLTPTQYNVLRILRGARSEALACRQIGERMVTPVPDVTRLVDRLVRAGRASRTRDEADRRVVLVRITDEGLALLTSLDTPMTKWLEEATRPLSRQQADQLVRLLRQLRQPRVVRNGG